MQKKKQEASFTNLGGFYNSHIDLVYFYRFF